MAASVMRAELRICEIGAACALDQCIDLTVAAHGDLKGSLNRWAVILPLPTAIVGAVVFDGELVSGHGIVGHTTCEMCRTGRPSVGRQWSARIAQRS